jgi:thiamine-monophosphate kinase
MPAGADSSGLDEFEIIARYFAPLASGNPDIESFRLLDDAATIRSKPGKRLVVTSDSIVAGVHFFGDEPADQIARKALRTNLSDLASKGARPVGYTLALHLPTGLDEAWLADFTQGLATDQQLYGISLLGGDTTRSDVLAISITAIGEVGNSYPARQDARAGDSLWVTGTIGDAALGLKIYEGTLSVDGESGEFLRRRYRLPDPRMELASILSSHANGAMDISDGLLADTRKMCRAAGLSARINLPKVPLSDAAVAAIGNLLKANEAKSDFHPLIFGGDDYEILFSAKPDSDDLIADLAASLPFAVTHIGALNDAEPIGEVLTIDADGYPVQFAATGHTHRF